MVAAKVAVKNRVVRMWRFLSDLIFLLIIIILLSNLEVFT